MLGTPTRGITLTEVIVASAIAILIALGVIALDAGRIRSQEALRRRSGLLTDQAQVALAASIRLAKSLESADRIVLVNGSPSDDVQLRTFDPNTDCAGQANSCVAPFATGVPAQCCYDLAANYRWGEYARTGPPANELRYYRDTDAGCANLTVLSSEVGRLDFSFVDAQPPVGADNNVLSYSLLWDNGLTGAQNLTHTFAGQVTSRPIPYSSVNANVITIPADSGSGLAPLTVSDPPAACLCHHSKAEGKRRG